MNLEYSSIISASGNKCKAQSIKERKCETREIQSLRTCAKGTLRHINTNIHTHRFIHTQMKDIHKHRLVYIYTYTGIHIVYTCRQMYTCIHIHHLHIYIRTHRHACSYTSHIHIYTCTRDTHTVTHARTCKHINTLSHTYTMHTYTQKKRNRDRVKTNKRRESGMAQWLRF